jgi:hypothetical protein
LVGKYMELLKQAAPGVSLLKEADISERALGLHGS